MLPDTACACHRVPHLRKPSPTKSPESKLNDPTQTAFTAFCAVKTRERAQHCVDLAAIAGATFPVHQIDLLEAALSIDLDVLEPQLPQKVANQFGDGDKTSSGEG